MLGAIGALPLVPLARTVGMRLGAVPSVPGAERIAGDIKLATFAEVAAAVVLVPFCAAFFGRLLPSILSRRSPRGSLSFEWAGMGMALSCLLWRSGLRPIVAVPIAAAAEREILRRIPGR